MLTDDDHDTYEDYLDREDECLGDDGQPTGSCQECDCNLYGDEGIDGLCDQCWWLIHEANKTPRRETGRRT